MKILIACQSFLKKGDMGNPRFNEFATYWSKQGHEITVVAGAVDYRTGQKISQQRRKLVRRERYGENITIVRCSFSRSYNKSFFHRFLSYVWFAFSSTIGMLFYIGKHDIIIASSPPLSIIIPVYLINTIRRIPFIFEVRDLWPKFAVDLGILKNKLLIAIAEGMERTAYCTARAIIVASPAFTEYLVSEKKVPEHKITCIPNAVDFDNTLQATQNSAIRGKFGWGNKFVVLYTGSHGVAVDLWQLLDVAKIVNNPAILFVLIGDGMEKVQLMEAAKRENIHNIQFLDAVARDEISAFINAADVCTATLNPVFTTTYPNKVFDYMACAKPIILPIDGAARRLVIDQADAGIFVEPKNPQQFKTALVRLYNDPTLAKEYGLRGRAFVRDNYNRAELAKRYLKIIEHVCEKKNT